MSDFTTDDIGRFVKLTFKNDCVWDFCEIIDVTDRRLLIEYRKWRIFESLDNIKAYEFVTERSKRNKRKYQKLWRESKRKSNNRQREN